MTPFERRGATIVARFTELERELLTDLATQIGVLLDHAAPDETYSDEAGIGGGSTEHSDPAIARLLPDAYRDDETAAREFRHLTEQSLAGRKIANAQAVIDSLAGGPEIELDPSAQQAWLRAIGDIRLVLAARLGIERDGDEGNADTDEDLAMRDIYDWLADVQWSLIEVLE